MSHSGKTTHDQADTPHDPDDINTNLDETSQDQSTEEELKNSVADNPDANQSDDSEIQQLRDELAAVQAKADENWNTILRMRAEMDNQLKRSQKQVEDAHKFSVQKFVEDLLPVADSLEMGMAAEGDIEKIREGIGLTMNVLKSVMEKFSVVSVDPLGEKFNPELHQAMAMQPSDQYEEGHISAVMQKGYTLNGRLVRPAMVMVVKN